MEMMELLEFTELSRKKDDPAKSLTLTDRKHLKLARALATVGTVAGLSRSKNF